MCTVTFLPLEDQGFILTSNRDEQKGRITLPPKIYSENDVKMLYPKDAMAGGTWIGVSAKNRLICVLNGGFEKHIRKVPYTKSRGLISKELLQTEAIEPTINALDLKDVEPFTMVIVDWDETDYSLYQLVWDADKKHFKKMEKAPHIWSSSTLYTKESSEKRTEWFKEWLDRNVISQESILKFHHLEEGDKEQTILMKRSYVETVSISSVLKTSKGIKFNYEDLLEGQKYQTSFNLQQR